MTTTMIKKAEQAMKNFKLLPSEIKKAEKFASKQNGKRTEITGYFHKGKVDEAGFITVQLEMCSNNMNDRENDVFLEICTFDRRMSFVHN